VTRREYIQIHTTVAKKSDAQKIADVLLKENLSACAQIIGPITSVYRWKGKTERTKEWLCIVKTKKSAFRRVEQAIKSVHPYDLPEIVALPIIAASKEYEVWLRENT
jgi:periplasmic divalent cation tolerance protein